MPSGKWRAQVRRAGVYRAATFPKKRDAQDWATTVESQAHHIAASGFAPVPKGTTLGDLIDKYSASIKRSPGKTKTATLAMLKREIGDTNLAALNAVVLRDFIDKRVADGAGGVTIAADLSFLSAVLKWGRHARQLDIPAKLAIEARESLAHRGLRTRSVERDREPTDDELKRLYAHWSGNPRQIIDMPTLCRFALATGMRLGEMCRLQVEDVDRHARTVVIRDRKDPRNKAGNDQTVPLLPQAWEIVERLIVDRDAGKIFRASADSVSTAFTRTCTALDIEDLHFHDLRHRATAEFFRMGLDIPRVALLTGHKTWTMLRRYTEIKPADVHAALKSNKVVTRNNSVLSNHPLYSKTKGPRPLATWVRAAEARALVTQYPRVSQKVAVMTALGKFASDNKLVARVSRAYGKLVTGECPWEISVDEATVQKLAAALPASLRNKQPDKAFFRNSVNANALGQS